MLDGYHQTYENHKGIIRLCDNSSVDSHPSEHQELESRTGYEASFFMHGPGIRCLPELEQDCLRTNTG
jgi:hypothetical protein